MSGNTPNLILSTYFCKKFVNPEKQIYIPKNDFNVIKNLYSKTRTQWDEADIRIFHDGLDREFITRYSKKWIKFVYVDTLQYPVSGKDIRIMVALDYIKENPQWERVFIVDSLTVKCVCNPFSAVDNNLNSLFIASEKKKLLSNSMFIEKLERIGEDAKDYDLSERKTMNADIVGGHRMILIPFLEQVQELLIRLHEHYKLRKCEGFSIKHNMIAVNYVSLFYDNILTGHPLHTLNKNYQMNGNAQGNLMFTFN
ncbi:MAG: hypothetical protein ACR2M6_00645 [Vampirovibrionia bacterium]|jgi:hypothetical protein